MRLLFLTPYLPSPPRFGGQRRVHGLMAGLAARHEVHLLSMSPQGGPDPVELAATQAICRSVTVVPNGGVSEEGRAKRVRQLLSLVSLRSYERMAYGSSAFVAALDERLRKDDFDAVVCEFAQMAFFDPRERTARERAPVWILDEHNVEYDIVRRTAESEAGAIRKLYSALDWRKLRAEEQTAWRRFGGVSVTSARDAELIRGSEPSTQVAVVPNGVDLEAFAPRAGEEVDAATILFFGALNYWPNVDGITWFLREVFPRVREQLPQARLRIVGPRPLPAIADALCEGAELVGFVDDLRAEIAKATCVVAPLRVGGGTRLKIVEAMASAKAIVSTTLGAEGLAVVDGHQLLLADEPQDFARAISRCVREPALRAELGEGARSLAERSYGWGAAVEQLTALIGSLRAAKQRSAA